MFSAIRFLSLLLCLLSSTTTTLAQTTSRPAAAAPITSNTSINRPATSASANTRTQPSASASASIKTPTTTNSASTSSTTAPDVLLLVPSLHVGRIELAVDRLQADLNLNANIAAGLVSINAGVQVSVQKVNITIADVDVELELVVRLANLVAIVERVFDSLDVNPLLLNLVQGATDLAGQVVGAVDGLLGSITQNGKTLNFLVDNLGNIVQEVVGGTGGGVGTLSQIVGNFKLNMTEVAGSAKQVGQGLTQTTYSYTPLNALVDIVTNAAGQVVSALVQKKTGSATASLPSSSSTASP